MNPSETLPAPTPDSGRTPARRAGVRDLVAFGPLVLVAACVVFVTVGGCAYHLSTDCPKSPWDAGMTVEAARVARGMSVYSDQLTDQASTMYGPAVPALTGLVFRVFGESNRTGKLLSALASAGVVLLGLALWARREAADLLVGAALFCAACVNTWFYFVEARPDMWAILLAFVALVAFADWEERGRVASLLGALALFVLAFFAKQTLGAAAAVPLVAAAFRRRPGVRGRAALWASAIAPVAVLVAAVAVLRAADPLAFFYMVTVPYMYGVPPAHLLELALGQLPLWAPVLLALFDLAVRPPERWDAGLRYCCSALLVMTPVSLASMARGGGWLNSLLPFYVAAAGLLVLRLPRALAHVEDADAPLARRVAASAVAALLLCAFAFGRPNEVVNGLTVMQGDEHFDDAVEVARELDGEVLCPEDPTIPLLARGEITRSIYFEGDTLRWPPRWPAFVDDDVASARFVIRVQGPFFVQLTDDWLTRLGFVRVDEPRLEHSVYSLWRRR